MIETIIKPAQYIGGPGYTFNRCEINLKSEVIKAELFIVADIHTYARDYYPKDGSLELSTWVLGGSQIKYRLFVNGEFVGLGPHRPIIDNAYFHEFDLTQKFKTGLNAFGVLSLGENRGFAAALIIECEDGSKQTIYTDDSWKTLKANDIFRPVCWEHPGIENFYKGNAGPGEFHEHIDGNLYPQGCFNAEFNDSDWQKSTSFGQADDEYAAQDIPNLDFEVINPERIVKLADGHFFFDFGKEVIAGIKINAPGVKGSQIELRLGEELSAPDRVMFIMRTLNCYQEIWTLAQSPKTLEHFGLRAFRYGEILGWPGDLTSEDVSAVVVRYPFDDSASAFECSDKTLKDVWDFCKYSIKATNVDIYQDCPARERHAYEGDAYINMLSHYAVDSDTRLAKHTAEYLLFHSSWPIEWKLLMIPIFWTDYRQSGDLSLIEKHYETLRDKFSYHHLLKDGLVEDFQGRVLIDWPDTQRDNYEFGQTMSVPNAYVYEDVRLLSKMADLLGRDKDKEEFAKIAENIKTAFNKRLFDESTGLYIDNENLKHSAFQSSLFALAFGLVPDDRAGKCIEFLKSKGMVCSVYSSQFFLDVLYKYNEADYALNLMTAKTGNSWGHMIYELGATIVTESWDPEQKPNMSWAHPWASAPVNVVARGLFGIRPIEPGYKKFSVNPHPGWLKWAEVKIPTPQGAINARIEKDNDKMKLNLTCPKGAVAIIRGEEYSGNVSVEF